MIVSAVALLGRNPSPDEDQVREALDGNLCRCGAHRRIVNAVLSAAAAVSQGAALPGAGAGPGAAG
jgi:aerobic-type carbon monoxide dehydrogenase small subunit (CoxS/CutS family)